MHKHTSQGMTLIEVLAALAIIAIALMAVIQTTGMSTQQLTRVQETAYAHWVAKNAAARLQLGLESQSLTSGAWQGIDQMAGRQYYWSAQASPMGFGSMLRIEVNVSATQGGPVLDSLNVYAWPQEET